MISGPTAADSVVPVVRWSKRKAATPCRSLSRVPSSPSSSGRSSPTHQDAVPGVLIKFVGEMKTIDDTPTFSLRILHEHNHGLYSSCSASSTLSDSYGSRSSTPISGHGGSQLTLKLPSHSTSGRSRRGRGGRMSYRESDDVDDASSDSDGSAGESGGEDTATQEVAPAPGRGRRRNQTAASERNGSAKKVCSSCNTKKTPYWREGWEPSIVLCNACGIRYQKYKKYCTRCVAIARKDDKGRLHCPECLQRL